MRRCLERVSRNLRWCTGKKDAENDNGVSKAYSNICSWRNPKLRRLLPSETRKNNNYSAKSNLDIDIDESWNHIVALQKSIFPLWKVLKDLLKADNCVLSSWISDLSILRWTAKEALVTNLRCVRSSIRSPIQKRIFLECLEAYAVLKVRDPKIEMLL